MSELEPDSVVRRLASKTIIVTGAAKGIGRVIAWRCASEGASVVLVDRDATELSKTLDDRKSQWPRNANTNYSMVAGDIAEQSTIERMVDTAFVTGILMPVDGGQSLE